jgi:hypothetical protein
MVLQSAWVTCTEEHSTSDHPDNTLHFCKPMHEALMRQPASLHKFGKMIIKNSTNSRQNDPLNRQRISYKMKGPNTAKNSNYISKLPYDSDFIPKSYNSLLLQYSKVQAGSLQNGI